LILFGIDECCIYGITEPLIIAYLPEVAYKSGGFTPSLKIREANFFLLDNIRDVKLKEKTNC
jgi:hypothetical protein